MYDSKMNYQTPKQSIHLRNSLLNLRVEFFNCLSKIVVIDFDKLGFTTYENAVTDMSMLM